MLTGAGMLNSCQQEDVANEVPTSKGVTIRANLPDDAQSRVSLGETSESGGKFYTKLCWESDDVIKVKIGETEYTFTTTDPGKTTATFTCEELPSEHKLPQGRYTFTCGSALTQNQKGTGSGIQMQATFNVEDVNGCTWDNVSLQFSAAVALVEISLPTDFTATKVTMYDANTGECLATTVNGTFTDKVYFSVSPNSSLNRKPVILAENSTGIRFVELTTSKPMLAGKLYRMNMNTSNAATVNTVANSNMKYFTLGGTTYMCGYGDSNSKIPGGVFKSDSQGLTSIKMLGITEIASAAFYQCDCLTQVFISYGVTRIESETFYSCENLGNIIIPATVNYIGGSAFQSCKNGFEINLLSINPPNLGLQPFGGNPSNYLFNVPSGSEGSYLTQWGKLGGLHDITYNTITFSI